MLGFVQSRTFSALFFSATLLSATVGRAQPEGAPQVQLPVVLTQATVKYPDIAISEHYFADVEVILILEVDQAGIVTKATPEKVAGHGFDDVAVAAAMTLRFNPATRNGQPIAARIKYRFVFHPPPAQLVGRVTSSEGKPLVAKVEVRLPDGSSREVNTGPNGRWVIADLAPGNVIVSVRADGAKEATTNLTLAYGEETNLTTRLENEVVAPVQPKPETEVVEEVNVQGNKPPREVTKRTLTRDEIDKIPGTNGDALRSLQSLPGVARPPALGGLLIVRGSAPAETTTYVDGTPIPLTYHFGGLSSVLPTETLDRIDFYPGNFGATYGRATAGIVDVGLRNPSKKWHGFAQLDLIDARLLLEGPIGKTGWTFLVAGRRSWLDAWLVPILEQTTSGISVAPRYYDYQMMLQKDFGQRASLRATFFGSDDALAVALPRVGSSQAAVGGGIENKTSFYRGQIMYRHQYSAGGEVRVVAAAGRDRVDIGIGNNFISTTEYPISLRSELSQKFGKRVRANLGLDVIYAPYELSLRLPGNIQPGQPPAPGTQSIATTASGNRAFAGAYTEFEIVPWRGGRIVPGLRADYTSTTETWDFAPRINMRQDLPTGDRRTSLKGGIGLYYQPPSALQTDPTYGQTGLSSNRALHYAAGVEQQISDYVDLSVELFGKNLDRLVVNGNGNSGEGRAFGAETLLRVKGHPRFFGWIAYTISRSERRDDKDEAWHLFQYDQSHNVTAVGSYDLGKGYRIGGRFRLISGNLYTPNANGGFDASVGSYSSASQEPSFSSRLPLFHQLDVRFDKTWTFSRGKLTAYVDIQNIYNRRAIEGVNYNFNFTETSYTEGLTILPSLGLRGEL